MCGICGIVSREPLDNARRLALKMNAALVHRGPDGAGSYDDARVALAVRRLSIIDLAGGMQPLYNENHSLVLIANAEIYNYVELRAQLEAKGHRFGTQSDCEVIPHLYEEYGLDCVEHLRGMFAFALWDKWRERLVLVRDRMGEKPIYLFERPGLILFASEMKALLRSGRVPFELDPASVNLYFHYQYVPEPGTPIAGVRKLDAAHMLIVETRTWELKEECYWRMEDAPPLSGDPAELLRRELETVSELVIRSDVPVGVALSGGLDSSAIAALAARKYPGTMHAFSVGYSGRPPYDERADARALADYLEMPFHDVELTTEDLVALFPDLVYWCDDPIADISSYGYYAVMQLARRHNVPVMFEGQGGDELFWGYWWTRQAAQESSQKAALWRKGVWAIPEYVRVKRPSNCAPSELRRWRDAIVRSPGWERLRRHRGAPAGQLVFYDLINDFLAAVNESRLLYSSEMNEKLNGTSAAALFTFPQPWPRVDIRLTRLVCETYLRENGITQGDRLGMASSVELRLPFLDHKLVETVVGLRKSQPDHLLPPKAWLKAACKNILPDWVLERPKQGFSPPLREWHAALFAAFGEQLQEGFLVKAGILNPIGSLLLAGGPFPKDVWVPLSFKALVLEMWCRQMSARSSFPSEDTLVGPSRQKETALPSGGC